MKGMIVHYFLVKWEGYSPRKDAIRDERGLSGAESYCDGFEEIGVTIREIYDHVQSTDGVVTVIYKGRRPKLKRQVTWNDPT